MNTTCLCGKHGPERYYEGEPVFPSNHGSYECVITLTSHKLAQYRNYYGRPCLKLVIVAVLLGFAFGILLSVWIRIGVGK